ncbi:MAG: DUF2911 domain-containing protein [Flavobacteriales bacterium]|nr:DUF2911 domain-containing protein [Flavobacteriales bacterium]
MSKTLKRVLIGILVLVVVAFAGFKVMQATTKKHSPEDTVSYSTDDLQLSVKYCRPFKKAREIFGGLVPYGEVWRTGANEPTTFTTSKTLKIQGQPLEPGTYTLWTIPGPTEWTVIWNSKMYPWGITMDQKASREEAYDVVKAVVPAQRNEQVEQFTIRFEAEGPTMVLEWDATRIAVELPN